MVCCNMVLARLTIERGHHSVCVSWSVLPPSGCLVIRLVELMCWEHMGNILDCMLSIDMEMIDDPMVFDCRRWFVNYYVIDVYLYFDLVTVYCDSVLLVSLICIWLFFFSSLLVRASAVVYEVRVFDLLLVARAACIVSCWWPKHRPSLNSFVDRYHWRIWLYLTILIGTSMCCWLVYCFSLFRSVFLCSHWMRWLE